MRGRNGCCNAVAHSGGGVGGVGGIGGVAIAIAIVILRVLYMPAQTAGAHRIQRVRKNGFAMQQRLQFVRAAAVRAKALPSPCGQHQYDRELGHFGGPELGKRSKAGAGGWVRQGRRKPRRLRTPCARRCV